MEKVQKNIRFIFIALLCLVLGYCLFGEVLMPDERANDKGYCYDYIDGWYQVTPNGANEKISIPTNLSDYGKGNVTISNILPDRVTDDDYIIFLGSKQDVDVYIGDELRTSFSTESTRLFGKNSPTYYVSTKLGPEDAGKTLTFVCASDSRYVGAIEKILYSNYRGFTVYMLESQGAIFAVASIMAIISLLSLLISLGLTVIYRKRQKLTSISIGVLIVSFWMLFDSMFRQYFFPNVSVISDVTFLMVALLPYPFAAFADQIQGRRYEKAYFIIKLLNVIEIVAVITLYCFGICELFDSFILMAGVLGVLLTTVFVTVVLDVINHHIREYFATALALFVAGLVMLVLIVIYLYDGETFNITIAAIGLFVLLAITMVDTIRDIYILSQEKQEALKKSYAKSQFLANMSHEIRTPINTILGMNTMILRNSKDDKITEYSKDIQSAGKNLLSLINDILDFSKIESGKMELIYSEYDIIHILGDISATVKTMVKDKGLIFNLQIDERIPQKYCGDDIRLREILINVLTNAVKYTAEGSVTFSIDLEGIEDEYALLHYSVKDTGMGIKPEDIDKLTKEYVRIDEIENKNIEGTGLGISIVVNLLRLMDSELLIDSVYGEGSNFHFIIRHKIMANDEVGDYQTKIDNLYRAGDEKSDFVIPDARLLVVDDNKMNRRVFINLLSDMQCTIDEAESGEECLGLVQKYKYDIVFMDYMMPEMDGVQTLRCMKNLGDYINVNTPVVILTANAISGAREGYLKEGFDEYLSKPIDINKLGGIIAKYIKTDLRQSINKDNEKKEAGNLPIIDGVNWDIALRNMGKIETLMSSIDEFLAISYVNITTLISMYAKIDCELDDFRIKVHSMKSNAAMLGAVHVAGLAKYLEYAARDKDVDTIDRLMPVFEVQWKQLISDLKAEFKSGDEDQLKPGLEAKEIKDKLDKLAEAMEEVNIDDADQIMDEIKKYSYSNEEKDLLEILVAYVIDLDVDNAILTINKWKDIL